MRIAMRRLGFEKLIDGKASRERDLIAAMVAGCIMAPEAGKLAMTHAWSDRLRAAKRKDLVAATERELQKIADMVGTGLHYS